MISSAMPTQEEIDLHRITHLPYRPWCPECVEGFAREWPHRHKEVQHFIILIFCDCLYLSKKGIFVARDELDEDKTARSDARTCGTLQCDKGIVCSCSSS